MAKAKKKTFTSKAQERRVRNWLAVRAHFKTGAGSHGDKKKKDNKMAWYRFLYYLDNSHYYGNEPSTIYSTKIPD